VIEKVKSECVPMVRKALGDDLCDIILYGSCARGDFNEDSDIDIALIINCDRDGLKKYDYELDNIAVKLDLKYFVVVNFVSLPQEEYDEKKEWYGYYNNIDREGVVLYGRKLLY
jgi:predicted nucleotidyltransferase